MNQAHMIADLLMALVFAVVFGMAYAFAVYKINQADDARGRRRIQRRAAEGASDPRAAAEVDSGWWNM